MRTDPSVLGGLLLLQSAMQVTPDGARLGAMLARGFVDLPGVRTVVLCLDSHSHRIGAEGGLVTVAHGATCDEKSWFSGCRGQCPFAEHVGLLRVPVRTGGEQYGVAIFDIEDEPRFAPYKPFVANTANLAALQLENGRRGAALEAINRDQEAELVRRAQALVESERRYRALVAHMTDIAWIYDVKARRFTFASESVTRLLGYPAAQADRMSLADLFTAEDDHRVRAEFVGLLGPNPPEEGVRLEIPHRRADGSFLWMEIQGAVLDAGEGAGPLISGVSRDVRQRRDAEERLRQSEESYRALVDAIPDIVFRLDRDGRVRFIHAGPRERLLVPAEEAVGRGVGDLLPPHLARQALSFVEATLRTGEPHDYDYTLEIDGEEHHYEARMVPCASSDVMVLVRDISAQKWAEQEKDRLAAQLQQAMKMEAVGRLAGGVAHDFNNLLLAILGNLELAISELQSEDPLVGTLREATRAAESAAELTRQLLAFSRKEIISPRVLDPNEVVRGAERMIGRLMGPAIELRTQLGADVGAVRVDPGQMEQILVNLAINARDAMPQGGTLRLETARVVFDETTGLSPEEGKPGDYVRLSVIDTGHGMSEEVRRHLFEPFFTTKERGRGTGLGLATIYGAVQQAGGFIRVESSVGEGARFDVHLPRLAQSAEGSPRRSASELLPQGAETVLLVEDEQSVLRLARRVIERLGYTVLPAASAEEALALARAHEGPIDLLMTDVVMPGMNGRELAEQMRTLHPALPVLFTSGYDEDSVAHEGASPQRSHFLAKPYAMEALARKLREVLDKS